MAGTNLLIRDLLIFGSCRIVSMNEVIRETNYNFLITLFDSISKNILLIT